MNVDEIIVTVKITKGKSNKLFYYEQFGKDSHWSRISQDYFEYYLKEYKDFAMKTDYDESNNVVLLTFKLNNERTWAKLGLKRIRKETKDRNGNTIVDLGFEKIGQNKPKGCFSFICLVSLMVAFLFIVCKWIVTSF